VVPGGRRWVEPEARRRLSFDHVRIVPRDDAALTVDGGPEKARSQRSGTRESLLDRLRPLSLAPDAGQVQVANDIVDARSGSDRVLWSIRTESRTIRRCEADATSW